MISSIKRPPSGGESCQEERNSAEGGGGHLCTCHCVCIMCQECEDYTCTTKGPCLLSRVVPRPSFLAGVVGQSQPSVGREGTITMSTDRLAKTRVH